ncbi:lipopolysaccharide biosynthesis protein [Sphingobacterium sp. UDSM-2020]|uniref:lipopolysaccharide biosynthesis protein n=1 Tax=Sphingobacterium sp. UDSM-2020 TaxID=2795738 RepID=UPI0019350485|nr:lipopolysaccharide biosynthesis protein [Sphingobacterium sp. UDSM-2020]QQD15362.1 lipopolysaccharide biosynthesis protein [Sphingobacterium sp. UDSM-2020]
MDKHSDQIVFSNNEISIKEIKKRLKDWRNFLLSKWYFFFVLILIGGGLGFCYAKFKATIFTATTTFVLESGESPAGGGLSQYAGIASMVGVDLAGGGSGIFQGDNLLELYKSRKMIAGTLLLPSINDTSKLIIDRYFELTDAKDRWKKKEPDLLKIDFSVTYPNQLQRKKDSLISDAVENINKFNLVVDKLDKKLSIIKVDVSSKNEIFSKEFNDALVQEVNDFYVRTKTKKSLSNIAILQHKVDSVRSVMNGNISTAAIVADDTPNLNPTKMSRRLIPTQRSQFSAETNKAILTQLVQNLELSKMSLLKESPLIQIVDQPILPIKKQFISVFKGLVAGLFIGFFVFLVCGTIGFLLRVR